MTFNLLLASSPGGRGGFTGSGGCPATGADGVMTLKDFECIFENFVGALLGLAGVLFFIMLIVGGFKYITSSGDPKQTASAQQTLTYAIYGLVLIAVSYLILVLIETITGVKVTNFEIRTN